MRKSAIILLFLFLVCIATSALAENFIGSVKTMTGKGFVVRAGELVPLAVGDHILLGDVLVTVKKSTMGVIFRDNSQAALGPETELLMDEFVFDPKNDDLGFLASIRTGTAAFLSGKIAKIAPEKVRVATPLTTIGIRGTRFVVSVSGEEAGRE